MIKKIIYLLILAGLSFGVYKYVMTSGSRNLETEKSEFSVDSKQLVSEFTANDSLAISKYLNKAIEIKGTVTDKNENQVILDGIVICEFKVADSILTKGKVCKIKGRFLGYDDLMGEIKLDNCFTVK
jgi:tRNA_anti-like